MRHRHRLPARLSYRTASPASGACQDRSLRTGTSKTGAVHRYYACSTCARKGKTVCKRRSMLIDKLDNLVTTHMTERLFQPERLAMILSSLASRRSEKADAVNARVTALQCDVTDADEKLKRLYRLIEDG